MRPDDTNPQKPWYRLKKVWAITGVIVLVVVIVAAGVTTEEPTAGDDEVIPTPTARVEPTATPEPTEEGCPTPTEGAYLLSYGTLLIEVSRILGELVEAGDLAVVDATVMLGPVKLYC